MKALAERAPWGYPETQKPRSTGLLGGLEDFLGSPETGLWRRRASHHGLKPAWILDFRAGHMDLCPQMCPHVCAATPPGEGWPIANHPAPGRCWFHTTDDKASPRVPPPPKTCARKKRGNRSVSGARGGKLEHPPPVASAHAHPPPHHGSEAPDGHAATRLVAWSARFPSGYDLKTPGAPGANPKNRRNPLSPLNFFAPGGIGSN
jgi:hypothetical protein